MRIHNNKLGNQILSLVLAFVMVLGMMPMTSFAAVAADEATCTCGTDDPAIHATNCAVYVAPENPVCTCVEKCTEANVWCDVCGFDYTACTGTDEAIAYEDTTACAHSFGDSGVCTLCGITGGYCGASTNEGGVESVTWTLADDGTLTISGSGAMADYDYGSNQAPWVSDRNSIQTVIIGDGISTIGNFAFNACRNPTSITIPGSVTSIGICAFSSCTSLISINIPNSVEYIGPEAFWGCMDLKSITIPNSVTSIGEGAFAGCLSLESVTISNSMNEISNNTFGSCTSLTSITIPESVTSIGDKAFDFCTSLTSITIPESVTSIGTNAFQNCNALTSVTANCKWKTHFPNYENIDTFTHTLVDGEYFASGNKIYYKCENECTYDSLVAARLELASDEAIYYTGSAITPEVKVTYVNGASTETLPLTVSKCEYSNNTEPGPATCTVTYKEGYVLTLDFTIRATPIVSVAPTVADRTYDPSVILQNIALTGGTVLDVSGNTIAGTWSWKTTDIVPEANNKGYVAVFTPEDTTYYDAVETTITVKVEKATPTVTAPTAVSGLIYSGEAQTLINAGNTTAGTMQYSLDNATWSTELPKATAAGEHTVYYKVVGNDNYNDVAEKSFTVTIACDHTHNTNEVYTPNDNDTHDLTCSICGELAVDDQACSGGTATCKTQAVCEICGTSYGELNPDNHEYDKNNGICCGTYQPAILNGDTESAYYGYYEIGNAGQLMWFANLVNGGTSNANAVLTKNITVNQNLLTSLTYDAAGAVTNGDSFRVWTPIGTSENYYTGTFDGNNMTVSGLYFNNSDTDYVGLFGYVGSGGKVQSIGVIDSYLSGGDDVGGVVGGNHGMVQNCYNSGTVTGGTPVGGVVGMNYSTVENCYNTGAVSGRNSVGGVVGWNSSGTVQNCYNTGSVSGLSYVGGVVGWNSSGTVQNCYNTSSVSGSDYVGGVVGWNNSGTVQNCYFNTDTYTGSAIGYNIGTVTVDGLTGGKTAAQFASGEVTWLLNSGVTDGTQVWYQTCEQGLPAFSGQTVYQVSVTYCDNTSTTAYSNVNENVTGTHKYAAPTFGWTSDYAECRAVFTCSICDASENVNCTVTADTTDPTKTVYTASAILNGVTYTDTKEVEHIISVDISWGAMEFTYTDGEWNPETHTYGEGKWTPDAENGNVITVTNNGNVAVNVAFAYTETVTEVEGSFTDESGSAITSPFALATEEEKKIKLMLNGKPSSTFEDTQLGSVTITITLPEEDES